MCKRKDLLTKSLYIITKVNYKTILAELHRDSDSTNLRGEAYWAAHQGAIAGDTAKARAAYREFLTLWKDADPDIPILKQAMAEYAKLQ